MMNEPGNDTGGIATDDIDEPIRLAGDPFTPVEQLWGLYAVGRKDVREALVGNPNAPEDLLLKLLPAYPKQFLANPALPLLLLERPGFFADLPDELMLALLRCEQCLPAVFSAARAHRQSIIRELAAQHVSVAGEAGDDWQEQAEAQLGASDLFHSGFPVILPREAIPDWVFVVAAQSASVWAREQVARYPCIPAALLEHFAHDPSRDVRLVVARHPRTPTEALAHLARSADLEMRISLLRNPALTDHLWRILVAGASGEPSAPLPELFQCALQEQDTHIRQAIASNPRTPTDLLAQLARGSDSYVRAVVAGNPQTPLATQEALAQDQNSWVRRAVAESHSTSAALLDMLAGGGDSDMRRRVAANPRTPRPLLMLLADDDNAVVRNAAQQQLHVKPMAQRPSRHALAKQQLDHNQFVALASPYMSAHLLRKWAHPQTGARVLEIHWALCYAIARNPSADDGTLDYLTHDADRFVRAAARDALARRGMTEAPR